MTAVNFLPSAMTAVSNGALKETYRSKLGVSFEWQTPDLFSNLPTWSTYYMRSPPVEFSGASWNLCIYPKGKSLHLDWITLELLRAPLVAPLTVSVGIKSNYLHRPLDHEVEMKRQSVFPGQMKSLVFAEFLHSFELKNRKPELAPYNSLTITCGIWGDVQPTEIKWRRKPLERMHALTENWDEYDHYATVREQNDIKSVWTLRKQFKDLLSSDEDYDVTIKVRGREFNAHKCVLRARSTVFNAMLKHEIEGNSDISIEDCDPDDFGKLLLHVYTGQVEDLSEKNAVELYYTADKYDVSCLKEACVHVLKKSLSLTVICDVLTLATKHGECELLEDATSFFTKNAKDILATPEWRSFIKTNPDEASELYIKSFEVVHDKEKKVMEGT